MAKGKRDFSIDGALTCDHSVTVNFLLLHAEIIASVSDQLVIFDKTALVKEQIYALSRSQLMIGMLFVDTGLATADERLFFDFFEALGESGRLSCATTTTEFSNR